MITPRKIPNLNLNNGTWYHSNMSETISCNCVRHVTFYKQADRTKNNMKDLYSLHSYGMNLVIYANKVSNGISVLVIEVPIPSLDKHIQQNIGILFNVETKKKYLKERKKGTVKVIPAEASDKGDYLIVTTTNPVYSEGKIYCTIVVYCHVYPTNKYTLPVMVYELPIVVSNVQSNNYMYELGDSDITACFSNEQCIMDNSPKNSDT
jgi:hypothetical protein